MWKNQPIAKSGIEHCDWFILPLLLATPIMQFSLDRKQQRHKQNQCSASDSVGLIFIRSYRSTLLITTLTTIPSLVKTSLNALSMLNSLNWSRFSSTQSKSNHHTQGFLFPSEEKIHHFHLIL